MSFPSLLHFADKTSFRSTEWPPSNLRGYGRIIFMSMRNKRGICVYCGREKKLTMDHVPPKLLFASPYPPNLPTVPSCRDCNASFQKDDEYTRVVAAVDYRAAHHEDVKTKLPAIQRSLARPDAKAFADYLDSQTSPTKIGETFSYVAGFGQGFSIWLMMLYGYFVWAGTTDSR